MSFPQAPAGAWWILVDGSDQAGFGVVGSHIGDVLDIWPNEVVKQVQVEGGGGPVREGYKVVALLLKPSLGLFGLVGQRQVLLPYPGSATSHLIAPGDHHTLQHIQVHFGIDFQADFEDVRWHDVALTWNHTKDHNHNQELFQLPGYIPVIRGNPDLHFEGASKDPVVITWISRAHELYSSASPFLLVKHYVTFRHDRRLLLLLGFVHNWPTSRWSATKKKKQFSLNGNGIMLSFIVPPCTKKEIKQYLSEYDSENEATEFPRFISWKSLEETCLTKLSIFFMAKKSSP